MGNPPVEGDSTSPRQAGVTGTNSAPWNRHSHNGIIGVLGICQNGNGVVGRTSMGGAAGVFGYDDSASGGTGVKGESPNGNGVFGSTSNGNMSGVVGENTDGGNGVYGTSVSGNAVAGNSQTANGGLFASQGAGDGVVGSSVNGNGVHGISSNLAQSGVWGDNNGGGYGVTGSTNAVSQTASGTTAGVWGNALGGGAGVKATSQSGIGLFASGAPAGYFEGDVQVTGDVILINSASGDVAEDFDLEDDPLNAEPGTVLVINSSGRLSASRDPYDTRVAGVVSGAGEFRPAVVLQRIVSETKRSPVALIGKTFCKVDATCGSIAAGDLLTTSATPGHAMTVSDRSQALGAILGKALGSLADGCGLIPILVSLR